MSDEGILRAKHRPLECRSCGGTHCSWCGEQEWPCPTARLFAERDALRETLNGAFCERHRGMLEPNATGCFPCEIERWEEGEESDPILDHLERMVVPEASDE